MSVERERGCGFRKLHGLYLVGGKGLGMECKQLPQNLKACPVCGEGIHQSRGFTWVIPKLLFPSAQECYCPLTLAGKCPFQFDIKQGLLWTGERFYTPESFVKEALEMGISKRISTVPKGFKVGEDWVFLAHPKAGREKQEGTDNIKQVPAVFYAFKPERIEKMVSEEEFKNEEEMKKLRERGITPVPLPASDADHQGSVYDLPRDKTGQAKLDEHPKTYQGRLKRARTMEA